MFIEVKKVDGYFVDDETISIEHIVSLKSTNNSFAILENGTEIKQFTLIKLTDGRTIKVVGSKQTLEERIKNARTSDSRQLLKG